MILVYFPTTKVAIDDAIIEFNESRQAVRHKLPGYGESNQTLEMGEGIEPIRQRRDIYQDFNANDNFFVLGYDQDDLLQEIEVHQCSQIKILDVIFDFNSAIDVIASLLSEIAPVTVKVEGEYFFRDLKISLLDKRQMGGEDDSTLGYFYCAADVAHLEE